ASAGAADRAGCDAMFPMDDPSIAAAVPEILFLCHNPVIDADRDRCGKSGTKARLGDLRYNFVNAIPAPQSGSPWGIMVDGVDPLTGEKVQGSVNVWDSVSHTAAQGAVDVIRWMNGELADDEIKSGAYINKYAITGNLQEKNFFDYRTMTAGEANQRVAALGTVTGKQGSK